MAKSKVDLMLADLRDLYKDRRFRKILWHILSMTGIYTVNYSNEQAAYMDGRKSIGLEILDMMNDADPTMYPRMLLAKAKEAQSRAQENGKGLAETSP